VSEGSEAREERCRLAALAASGPLMLLVAPAVLAFDGERSIAGTVQGDPRALGVIALFFVWPLLAGALGLRGAVLRRAPGAAAYAVPAVLHALAAGALLLLLGAEMFERRHTRGDPVAWAVMVTGALVIYVMARGFRREGWHRWAQLVAGLWLCHVSFAVSLWFGRSEVYDPPAMGGWLQLFGLAAALPAIAWAAAPRRGLPDRGSDT
jgi:peptidoglycan/LPS O-acetylase OafA/YrhL